MTKRETYIGKMKAELDLLDAKMSHVETQAAEARADIREKYQEEMAKLREQSRLAGVKLAEIRSSSEDNWEKMKAEMEKVRDAFTHSFRYFKSQV
jgi:sRNA-binding protein